MKKVVLILALANVMGAFAQSKNISFAKKSKEPITVSDGTVLSVGGQLQLGIGTSYDGGFKYIRTLSAFNEPLDQASSRVNNKKEEIKFFKTEDEKVYLFTNYFVIDIESAIYSGEVITDNSKKKSNNAGGGSVADELKKLKELLDSGAITQEEYDKLKKKLIDN